MINTHGLPKPCEEYPSHSAANSSSARKEGAALENKRQVIPSAYSSGWMLCNPTGKLQPATLRRYRNDAIAAKFRVKKTRDAAWAEAEGKGWTARFVYVRFFIPVFKSTNPRTEEVCDVEDI